MRILVLLGFLLIHTLSFSQVESDKISELPPTTFNTDTQKVLEVFKIKSNKVFRLEKGSKVWIRIENKKGVTKIKQCQITNIGEDTITFKPYDKDYAEIKYAGSDIMFIAFTSAGRIILATISNVVIVCVVVVVYAVALMMYILSAGSLPQPNGNSSSDFQLFVPFRKNISFYDNGRGGKWGLRIVDIPQ